MLTRTILLSVFFLGFGETVFADTLERGDCTQSNPAFEAPEREPTCLSASDAANTNAITVELPPAADDIRGSGPPENNKLLRQLAIYAAIGNRDGVEILSRQLRDAGVSGETIDEVVTWTRLHGSRAPSEQLMNPSVETEVY